MTCIATFAVTRIEGHREQNKNSGETILELPGDAIQTFAWEHNGEALAFQYEFAIDALLAKGVIDRELAAVAKEKFYDALNEEKLRTSRKIRDYRETIPIHEADDLQRYSVIDGSGKAIFCRASRLGHSKLDAQPQCIGISPSMGR